MIQDEDNPIKEEQKQVNNQKEQDFPKGPLSKDSPENPTPTVGGKIKEYLRPIAIAVFLALLVRSFLIEPYRIPTGSMVPTLLVGDFVLVEKYAYGYSKYSFPLTIPFFSGRLFKSTPKRGDVIVFREPKDTSVNYIKRLVGLPGDKIYVNKGILFINDEPVQRSLVGSYYWPIAEIGLKTLNHYKETFPTSSVGEGQKHDIIEISDNEPYDNTATYVVPEGYYFMMGDNRDYSQDSRYLAEVGFVPEQNLVGKATRVAFSFEKDISIWKPWTWITAFRFRRIFHSLYSND